MAANVEEWLRKADAGDSQAMLDLGDAYKAGSHGLAKDHAKALEWFTKSHKTAMSRRPSGWSPSTAHEPPSKSQADEQSQGHDAHDDRDADDELEEEDDEKEDDNPEEALFHWRREAEAGDGPAMANVGNAHFAGTHGLAKNHTKAYVWFAKAHDAGYAGGTAWVGLCRLHGTGIEQCTSEGLVRLADAARQGSRSACYWLGKFPDAAWHGFCESPKLTREYYSMMANAPLRDASPEQEEEAASWLRDHQA